MISRRTFHRGQRSWRVSLRRRVGARRSTCSRRSPTLGRRHDRVARPLARLAHGRALPARLPDRGQVAPAAVRRRVGLRRSDAQERPEPRSAPRSSASRSIRPIAEALRCGGDKLAVDAVLIIGEHGDYPRNEIGQKQYPRYEFFQAGRRGLPQGRPRRAGLQRQAPVVELGLGAGDGRHGPQAELPVPGRLVAAGDVADAGDRPAVRGRGRGGDVRRDRRRGQLRLPRPGGRSSAWPSGAAAARRGVVALQALRGDAVWKAMAAGSWTGGGWDPALFEACLCRSQTLAQPPTFSHRYPTRRADARVGQGAGRLPLRVRRRRRRRRCCC